MLHYFLMQIIFKFWDILGKKLSILYLSKAIKMIFYSLLKDSTNWGSTCPRLAKSEFWMILVATQLIYLQRVLNQVKAYVVLVITGTFLSDCNWTRTQNHLVCKRTKYDAISCLLCQVIPVKVFQTKAWIFLLQTSL